MHYYTKKRIIALISVVLIIGIISTLVSFNNATTPTMLQKLNFNEKNATQESRIVLDKFLKVSDNKTFIANADEKQKIKEFIDNKCNEYFTDNFINDTTNELSTKGFGDTPTIFYLTSDEFDKISFYNNYTIYSSTVDNENETITYNLKANDIVYVPALSVYIEMIKDKGKWKINKVTE